MWLMRVVNAQKLTATIMDTNLEAACILNDTNRYP